MTAILKITDGTTSIDLINSPDACGGFYLTEWMPQVSGYKNDGTWQDSSLANGRTLAMRRFASVVETFTLHASGTSQDALVRYVQDLRRLLEKAADYWTTEWQDEPVWLEARASCETNTRYSIVSAGRIAEDKNPYSQPFMSAGGIAVFDSLTLVVEREPFWRHVEPGEGECVPLSAVECYCEPSYIECNGTTTLIDCGNPAKLNNLPDFAVSGKGQITFDGWIRSDGTVNTGYIGDKVSWVFNLSSTQGLSASINCAAQNALSRSGLDEFTFDTDWHHLVMTYDETGAGTPAARTIYLAIDGVWVASYVTQQVSIGNYNGDAANNLHLCNTTPANTALHGDAGWLRVSDNVRFLPNVSFTPPPRCALPVPDANTMWLGIREGTGATVYDLSATPSNGTLTDGTWDCDCDQCYGNVLGQCGPAYLEFNGGGAGTSFVDCGSNASLDDIPDNAVAGRGQLTAQAWIRADGYGEGNQGRIVGKSSWFIACNNAAGLYCSVACAAQTAISTCGLDEFTADGIWHHVLMTYSETGAGLPAARTIYLAIDGVWVTSYPTQQVSIGNYTTDAAASLFIGNNGAATTTFDGNIAWVKVSDAILYDPAGGNFTPEIQCALPTIDANTMLNVIYEGIGLTTCDRSGYANDGAITDAPWGCDCYPTSEYSGLELDEITREPTCEDEVYFGNRNNEANVTNVHFYDSVAGAWSANIQAGALPAPLLPGAPAAGDVIVFMTNATLVDANPFCSLIFDLLQEQTDLEITWRYSQGGVDPTAWPALTVQDNTNYDAATGVEGDEPFTRTGVHGVFWEQPSDWENTRNPTIGGVALGVTGYAVAAHVTAVGANPAPPIQQHRDIYSVVWSYVEIQSADVLGDVLALGRSLIRAKSDSDIDTAQPPSLWFNRLIISARGYDRGNGYFRAFLQASDTATWNDTNLVRCYPLVSAAFGADPTAPTGRAVTLTNPAAAWNSVIEWRINEAITQYYRGKYRAFLRVDQTSGVADDLQFRIQVYNRSPGLGYAYPVFLGDVVVLDSVQPWATVDLGTISIPPSDELVSGEISSSIIVQCYGNGASDCTIYDLAIMPIDEICVECVTVPFLVRPNAAGHQDGFISQKLEVDAITLPKHDRRSFISNDDPRGTYADVIVSGWNTIGADPFSLQANSRHRLYFLAFRWDETVLWTAPSWITNSAQLYSVNRYLSMRGGR